MARTTGKSTKQGLRGGGRRGGSSGAKGRGSGGQGAAGRQKGKGRASRAADAKRKLGLRGAAPWAARHAAKHAAEARARNATPAPPGSARATLRVPARAEEIKARIGELHGLLSKVRALCKGLPRGFFELAIHLRQVRDERLYEAKGYGSFENFVERELELGKATVARLLRVPDVFLEAAAVEHGMDAVLAALQVLDGAAPVHANNEPRRLPLKPPSGDGA